MSETGQTTCPVCGSSDLSTMDGVPHPTCDSCGTLVDGDYDRSSPAHATSTSGESAVGNWSSYSRVGNSTEKQVAVAIEEIEALGELLNLGSEVRERAAEIYADAAVSGHTDGRSTEAVTAVVACLAARENSTPRPVDYIAREADVPVAKLRRLLRVLQNELEYTTTLTEPADFLDHLCQSVNAAKATRRRAQERLSSSGSALPFCGKNPGSIAAAALYLESDRTLTQRELARASGVTEETIRVRVKDFREEDG